LVERTRSPTVGMNKGWLVSRARNPLKI
jgi:hypothetical protein